MTLRKFWRWKNRYQEIKPPQPSNLFYTFTFNPIHITLVQYTLRFINGTLNQGTEQKTVATTYLADGSANLSISRIVPRDFSETLRERYAVDVKFLFSF